MSSSETDSEVSCPSDDSNYNFIPQYMIEDAEIQVENRLDDEGSSASAYADEPLADELLLHVSTQAFYYSLANSLLGLVNFYTPHNIFYELHPFTHCLGLHVYKNFQFNFYCNFCI